MFNIFTKVSLISERVLIVMAAWNWSHLINHKRTDSHWRNSRQYDGVSGNQVHGQGTNHRLGGRAANLVCAPQRRGHKYASYTYESITLTSCTTSRRWCGRPCERVTLPDTCARRGCPGSVVVVVVSRIFGSWFLLDDQGLSGAASAAQNCPPATQWLTHSVVVFFRFIVFLFIWSHAHAAVLLSARAGSSIDAVWPRSPLANAFSRHCPRKRLRTAHGTIRWVRTWKRSEIRWTAGAMAPPALVAPALEVGRWRHLVVNREKWPAPTAGRRIDERRRTGEWMKATRPRHRRCKCRCKFMHSLSSGLIGHRRQVGVVESAGERLRRGNTRSGGD